VLRFLQPVCSNTSTDYAARFCSARQQGIVENVAGEGEGGEGEAGFDQAIAHREPKKMDLCGSQLDGVQAGLMEIADCLGAEKLAADFVVSGPLPFNEGGLAAVGGEEESGHGAGEASAQDQTVGLR
jgi:hypothetical protein